MQKTKWYKIRENRVADFTANSPITNVAVLKLIGEAPFQVCEVNVKGSVIRIGLYVDGLYSTYALSDIVADRLHNVIIARSEFGMFEETEIPSSVWQQYANAQPKAEYLIFVSEGDSTFVVGPTDNPQLFTKEQAEEHIEFILKDSKAGSFCQMFKLDATYEAQVKIVKK